MHQSTRRELIKRLGLIAAAGYAAPQVVTLRPALAAKKKKRKKKRPPPTGLGPPSGENFSLP